MMFLATPSVLIKPKIKMKKFGLISLFILSAMTVNAQSSWDQNKNDLTLNSQLLMQHTAQGAFYGAGGYGLGMWLSGNNTTWGMIGSVLAANIPILLEKKTGQKEVLIGRNIGALTVGIGFTVGIELTRRNNIVYSLPYWLRKR